MYNRYIPGSGQPGRENGARNRAGTGGTGRVFSGGQQLFRQLGESLHLFGGETKNAGIAGILKDLGLSELDVGDILLMLILLMVFLEGNHTELVVTLALMLLLGEEEYQME